MLQALANIVTRRARTVLVTALALSVLAGVLGTGVASRLDPYGANDPATESVQADNRLDAAGFQSLGVIALVRGVDVSSPGTKQRLESLASRIANRLDGVRGATLGGPALAQEQVNHQVESDLRKAEMFAFPLLVLLSLL